MGARRRLSVSKANALAVMGAFVLFFIIRMAGATMEQKEEAEASMRLSEDRFRSLIQNSSDATMVMDEQRDLHLRQPGHPPSSSGMAPDDLVGQMATDFVHPDDRERVRDRLGAEFQAGAGTDARPVPHGVGTTASGATSRPWSPTSSIRPSVAGYVANIRDITERKEFEALLAHRALHDPLTGLANRQLILDRAEQMLARVRRTFDPVAAYFIDLDNFKDANDSLGHEAGDKLLQAVAARLTAMLRASDTVGRLGGDEFVILVEGVSLATGPDAGGRTHPRGAARAVPDRRVRGPPDHGDRQHRDRHRGPGHGPGAAARCRHRPLPGQGGGQEQLRPLRAGHAVGGHRSARAAVGPRCRPGPPASSSSSTNPSSISTTCGIRGVEALIRWRHPLRGDHPPDDFIPLLEDSGPIIEVGRWVLGRGLRPRRRSGDDQGHPMAMSVNVSMRQLESDRLVR